MDTIDTTGNPHTGDYLAKVMEEALGLVKAKFKVTVVGIVTDNASNMENMRSKLLDSMVFTCGCQAHVLNLLAKDLLADKGRATASEHILAVLDKFRSLKFLSAALKKVKVPKPPKPSDTRWCY